MLVAFNFDGSLAQSDVYALLAEEAGVAEDVAAIADQTRAGEFTLREGLEKRVERLEGLPEIEVAQALERVSLRPGAGDLVADLQEEGHHVAVVTAAPQRAVQLAFEAAGAPDSTIAPVLGVDGERNALTGEVSGRLLEESKGEAVSELAVEGGYGLEETLAVGTSATDREMLEAAADGICFSPTAGTDRHCETVVDTVEELRGELEGRSLL